MPRAVVSGTLIGLVVPAACGPGKHSAGTPSPRRYFTISRRKPAWQGTGKPLPSPAFDRTCNKSNPRRCAMQTADVREKMTQQQVRAWDVLDERVLDVMRQVPRELFVPAGYGYLAYADLAGPLRSPGRFRTTTRASSAC